MIISVFLETFGRFSRLCHGAVLSARKRVKRKYSFTLVNALGIIHVYSSGGGRCLQGNLWYSPPASMTSRLASLTFKMASKVFIEEIERDGYKSILSRKYCSDFLGLKILRLLLP